MIYLDMDGVLADFDTGVCKLFGKSKINWTGKKSVDEALGIGKTKMWRRIDEEGFKFWANLKPLPWANKLWSNLSRLDEVVICTTPSLNPVSASGKMKWQQNFLGRRNFRDFVITPHKHLLAKGPNTILIDDREKNIDAFSEAGGVGILFPRPWNKQREQSEQALEYVFEQLKPLYPSRFKGLDFDDDENDIWSYREEDDMY